MQPQVPSNCQVVSGESRPQGDTLSFLMFLQEGAQGHVGRKAQQIMVQENGKDKVVDVVVGSTNSQVCRRRCPEIKLVL